MATTRMDDDDELWSNHDGGSGHDEPPQWEPGDRGRALTYWDTLDDTGRRVHRYLFADPGRRISGSEIVAELDLDPDGAKNAAKVMSGSLSRAGAASAAAGRCYPYRWWKTPDGAVYAVKYEMAEIFSVALSL
ncbi:DUF6416 domain-containing protein [Streptodolium elevatio]|uniref:DUF6416 domain-containing protein n=1 Tax=Streptodolium elevatio TaxID=3157996 RepID=A0ABV3DHZ6_9ACTN